MDEIFVGVSSCVAFIYCLLLNGIHIYLTKTSKMRKPIFYRRILPFSHLSMLLMLFAAMFMICSYFHPELLFDNCCTYCVHFYITAVICYVVAMYLLKTAYLVRLNMVFNPTNVNQWSLNIQIYLIIFIITCITISIIQGFVIQGKSFLNSNTNDNNNINNNNYKKNDNNISNDKFGCIATFASWNGWIAFTILGIDALKFY